MSLSEPSRFDLVIAGGRVLDERNGVDAVLDVAVANGRIAAVGPGLAAQARRTVDASGAIVAPGLIDIHTHVYHKATSLSVDRASSRDARRRRRSSMPAAPAPAISTGSATT